jgi:HD superfamily phosphohydrolase
LKKTCFNGNKINITILSKILYIIELLLILIKLLDEPKRKYIYEVRDHSLACAHLIRVIQQKSDIQVDENYIDILRFTSLLHDIGHAAFSHVLEYAIPDLPKHEDMTVKMINGKFELETDSNLPCIKDVLDNNMRKKIIDHLNKTSLVGDLVGGPIVNARFHMFEAVYQHHAVLCAELMLSTTISRGIREGLFGYEDLYRMGDAEVINYLAYNTKNDVTKKMLTRVLYRRLYKRAYIVPSSDKSRNLLDKIDEIKKSPSKYDVFVNKIIKGAHKYGSRPDNSKVLIYLPKRAQFKEINELYLQDDNGIRHKLSDLAPKFANEIQGKYEELWKFYVFVSEEKLRDSIGQSCHDILGIPSMGERQPYQTSTAKEEDN